MSKATNVPKAYKDLALVPESVLKRRHDLDDLRRRQLAIRDGTHKNNGKRRNQQQSKSSGGVYVVTPHKVLAKTKSRINYNRRLKRIQKKGMQKRAENKKTFEVVHDDDDEEDEREDVDEEVDRMEGTITTAPETVQSNSFGAKIVLVIRVRGGGQVPPQYFRKLRAKPLNLVQAYQATLVRYTPEMRSTLHFLEPWIVYGIPSEATIRDLLERKSFGRDPDDSKAKVPISDNVIVEKHLGEHDILCMEDLAHVLSKDDDQAAFDAATSFLWPFQLTNPKSHFETTTLKAKQGHDYGDKGQLIDEYVRRMA